MPERSTKSRLASPKIQGYTDYRAYLHDYYAHQRLHGRAFSLRRFAKSAEVGSSSYLLMVMKGQRNLSVRSIPKFSKALGLSGKSAEYFECLVHYNQAKALVDRDRWFRKLCAISPGEARELDLRQYSLLSKWFVPALYELIRTHDFSPDFAWISRRMKNRITAKQARAAFDLMLELGLIVRDGDRYRQVDFAVRTADEVRSVALKRFHKAIIYRGYRSLDRDPPSEREFGFVTVAVPRELLPEVKDRIRRFRSELNQYLSAQKGADEVYQFNVQFFPLTSREFK